MTKPKYIKLTTEFTLIEDDWNRGELKVISRWDEDDDRQFDSIEELLKSVDYLDRDGLGGPIEFENDPASEGDASRFDASITVDIEKEHDSIVKPTVEKLADWKAGKCLLYTLQIFVRAAKLLPLEETDAEAKDYSITR